MKFKKWPRVESWWRQEQYKGKYIWDCPTATFNNMDPIETSERFKSRNSYSKRCHKDSSTFEASAVKRKGSQRFQGCCLVNTLNSFHLRQKSQVYWILPSPSIELLFHDIHHDCWGAHLCSNSRDQQMAISQRRKICPCNFNVFM